MGFERQQYRRVVVSDMVSQNGAILVTHGKWASATAEVLGDHIGKIVLYFAVAVQKVLMFV